MIAGFLIYMALALTIGVTLTLCAVVVGAREDRSLPGALGSSPWSQIDAWEEHVRTTPGVVDGAIEACDMDLWEFGDGGAAVSEHSAEIDAPWDAPCEHIDGYGSTVMEGVCFLCGARVVTVIDAAIPPWCVEHQAYNCPHTRGERPRVLPPGVETDA